MRYWEIHIDKLRMLVASIVPNYVNRDLIYFLLLVNFCLHSLFSWLFPSFLPYHGKITDEVKGIGPLN